MEEVIKKAMQTEKLICYGRGGGGCINEGQSYTIDDGSTIYVKYNKKNGARQMFEGEFASLATIAKTNTIKVPKPLYVADNQSGALLVMEHLDMTSLGSRMGAQLGKELALMHLHNSKRIQSSRNFVGSPEELTVAEFGFDLPTCCGYLPLENSWHKDWVHFYSNQRLNSQMNMDEVKTDREAQELWGHLLRKIPQLFKGLTIYPSLLHGDLWGGNVAQLKTTSSDEAPVIFDPASFYGHHEFEFGIVTMFGGFNSDFFEAYHGVIPKSPGFDKRMELYRLFHNLNHWNHFGSGYRGSSISTMNKLIKQ